MDRHSQSPKRARISPCTGFRGHEFSTFANLSAHSAVTRWPTCTKNKQSNRIEKDSDATYRDTSPWTATSRGSHLERRLGRRVLGTEDSPRFGASSSNDAASKHDSSAHTAARRAPLSGNGPAQVQRGCAAVDHRGTHREARDRFRST